MADRPDEVPGLQVHVVYVLPRDAVDAGRDTSGELAAAVTRLERWMLGQTNGRRLRFDTSQGQVDATAFRSAQTIAELTAPGATPLARLKPELQAAGFVHGQKLYALLVELTRPSTVSGHAGDGVAAVYLGACPTCEPAQPTLGEETYAFVLGHEVLHALGFVPACAPHAQADGHVGGEPRDLMALGAGIPEPVLDPGHDDYFGHGRPGCRDLARSLFLEPIVADPDVAIAWPLTLEPARDGVAWPAADTLAGSGASTALASTLRRELDRLRTELGRPALEADERLTAYAVRFAAFSGRKRAGDATAVKPVPFAAGILGPTSEVTFTCPTEVATAEAIMAQPVWRNLFAREAGLAGVTGIGVGTVQSEAGLVLTMAVSRAKLALRDVTLGEGPHSSYTLAGQLRLRPGQGLARAFLRRDTETLIYPAPFETGEWHPFTVSLPRRGRHELRLAYIRQGQSVWTGEAEAMLTVDADRPLAAAIVR